MHRVRPAPGWRSGHASAVRVTASIARSTPVSRCWPPGAPGARSMPGRSGDGRHDRPRRRSHPRGRARHRRRARRGRPRRSTCTGRSTRARRSEIDRPETIEETAELVTAAGRRRHPRPGRPPRLGAGAGAGASASARSTSSSTTSGAPSTSSSSTPRCGSTTWPTACGCSGSPLDTHLITSHYALPRLNPGGLVVEMTDGTAEYNATHYRVNAVLRPRARTR